MAVQVRADRQAAIRAAIESGEGQPMEFLAAPVAPRFHNSRTTRINKSMRYAAVEIEVGRARRGNRGVVSTVAHWGGAVVRDGSVSGGYEINTAPANGDLLIEQLAETCFALEESENQADRRCGVHVHVDARDFRCIDIKRVCLLWDKVEAAMFQLVLSSRRTSRYCLPCAGVYTNGLNGQATESAIDRALANNVYGSTIHAKTNKYSQARYRALNIHSWFYRQTLEFRLHQGVTDRRKITNWTLLCLAIVDAAKNLSEAEIVALDGSSLKVLIGLAPKNIRKWMKSRVARLNGLTVEQVEAQLNS